MTTATTTVTINNQEFTLSPLDRDDIAQLDLFVQGRAFAIARASLPEGLAPTERHARLAEYLAATMSLSWGRDGLDSLRHFDVLTHFVWVSLRRRHPRLTPEEVADLLNADPAAIERIFDAISTVA